MIQVFNSRSLLYSCFIFMLSVMSSFAQEFGISLKKEREGKYCELIADSVLRYDNNNLLNKKLYDKSAIFWKDRYWFFQVPSVCKSSDRDWYMELYSFDAKSKKINKITNSKFKFVPYYTSELLIFQGMFLFDLAGKCSKNVDYPITSITMVDPDHPLSEKCLIVSEMTWSCKINRKDDFLYIFVQPCYRKFNFGWILNVFPLHDEEPKWYYPYKGNRWLYIYDKNLNFIAKKETNIYYPDMESEPIDD